jgi:hypothetical protein
VCSTCKDESHYGNDHNMNTMLTRSHAALLLLFIRISGVVSMFRRENEIITTTACSIRLGGYEARLELDYFYKVEYVMEPLNLFQLERSIAASVASALKSCDENNMPIYAVEVNLPSHELIDGGKLM